MRRTEPASNSGSHFAFRAGLKGDNLATLLVCIMLATAVFVAFSPVLTADFINFDDTFYVTDNPHVNTGIRWTNVVWAFSDAHLGTWHPVTWLSHMLDVQLFGLKANRHHLINLLTHIANTSALFLLLRKITAAFWRSALVAILFGLHPLHVESVAWISERKDVLSGLFGLLTIWAYANYAGVTDSERGQVRGGWYALALLFFALGLMSKPMLVSWPVLLLLLDFWPLRRLARQGSGDSLRAVVGLITEKLPFVILAIADGVMTVWTQRQAGAMKSLATLPPVDRAANAVVSYARYVWKAFWPTDLAVFYPFPKVIAAWNVTLALVILTSVSVLAWKQARKRPYVFAGWFWYVITITPVVGFVHVGMQAWADRYSYLPLVGIFICAVWTAEELIVQIKMPDRWTRFATPIIGVGALIATLVAMTAVQASYWRSSETLFRHALAATKDNALAHQNLGVYLIHHGDLDEAVMHFKEAMRIEPPGTPALAGPGQAEVGISRSDKALSVPRDPERATRLFDSGNEHMREGKLQDAIRRYEQAVLLDPDLAMAQNNLANALQRANRAPEAIPHYQEALRVKPNFPEAHNNLAIALASQGYNDEAISECRKALALKPDYAEAYNNLANIFMARGDTAQAITNYQNAIQHRPNYVKAQNSLGGALEIQGRTQEAIEHFRTALRLAPGYPDAHFNLGKSLLKAGETNDALAQFQAALELAARIGESNLVRAAQQKLDAISPR